MSVADFEQTLRRLRNEEPFHPFLIRLNDGEIIFVDKPLALGFSGGSAAFISAPGDVSFFKAIEVVSVDELFGSASDEPRHGVP